MRPLISVFCVVIFLLSACQHADHVEIHVDLPVNSPVSVSMYNMMTGKEVFQDSLGNGSGIHRIDSISPGGYRLIYSWDRQVVQMGEMRNIERYGIAESPKFYLNKEIWITKERPLRFELKVDYPMFSPVSFEESLLYEDVVPSLVLVTNDRRSQKFNEFVEIEARYREYNRLKKDSLKSVMYEMLDANNMEEHAELSKIVNQLWLDDVMNDMLSAEVLFLKANVDHPMVPYLLVTRISSPEDFKRYQEVYEALPFVIREKTKPHLVKFM